MKRLTDKKVKNLVAGNDLDAIAEAIRYVAGRLFYMYTWEKCSSESGRMYLVEKRFNKLITRFRDLHDPQSRQDINEVFYPALTKGACGEYIDLQDCFC